MASTSLTAQADSFYIGPFGQNVSGSSPNLKFGGLTFTTPTTNSVLSTTVSQNSTASAIEITDLSLKYGTASPGDQYLSLPSNAEPLSILNLQAGQTATTLKANGMTITGEFIAPEGPGTLSTKNLTVLNLGTGTGALTVNNNAANNINFTAVGVDLTGFNISANQIYNYEGTQTENYSATSDSGVTAVQIYGTGNWTGSLSVQAIGTAKTTPESRNYVNAFQIHKGGSAKIDGAVSLTGNTEQGKAWGLSVGESDGAANASITGSTLDIEVSGKAGTWTPGNSDYAVAEGIILNGTGTLTITSNSIAVSATSIGNNNKVASQAEGVTLNKGAGATINLGTEKTTSIVINATAYVTGSTGPDPNGPRDSAYGVLASSGTINIGNPGSTTTITAGLDKTPPQENWYGNVQGIRVWGETTTANVNLAGTGTINVPQYEEGYSANINNYAILVSAGGPDLTGGQSTLTVKGDWIANGQVGIGITSVKNVAPSTLAIIEGGSLTVNGDVLVKPVTGNSDSTGAYNLNITDGALNVEGTLSNNDAGTVTVGGTDADGNPTNGSLTATNVVNEGTSGNGITINEGSTASVTGADPTGGAAFNNTGSLTVNGDLTVDNTLQNSEASGSIVVGGAGPDGAKGNLTAGIIDNGTGASVQLQSGTLTVDDVQNSGTFSTDKGTTLVVTGTVNADEDGNPGSTGSALTVNGDLVTNAGNLFADSETNTLTNNTFTLSGAEQVTVDGTLTQAQAGVLSGAVSKGSIVVTDGIVYEAGITGYQKQQFLEQNDIGDLSFTYTQKNTKGPDDKTVLTNLAIGARPTAAGPIDKAYIDKFFPAVTSQNPQQYDLWSNTKTNTMAVGAINLGSGTQIYVASSGTLQIGGLNGNLVTSDAGDPTIMVAGNLILGAKEGGNNAAANNLTVNVISGNMTVQGNVVPGAEKLTYGVGTVNLGSVKTTTTPATEGDLLVDNANLNVGTLNATAGSTIGVTNGTLTVATPVQLTGTKTTVTNPTVTLDNGSLASEAGLTATYMNISTAGESSLNVGSAPLSLTNSQITSEAGTTTITAGTVTLTDSEISLVNGTVTAGTAILDNSEVEITSEGSITFGDTTLTESRLTAGNGSITMASATLTDSTINVTDGDLTINGTLTASASTAKTNSTITVNNGSLTTGVANIGSGADVTVNVGPTASVSMGATTLAGTLTVNPSADATTLAPVTLASLAFGEESGSFVAGQQLAVQIGVDNMQAVNDAIAQAYPGVDFDNVLAIGSTVLFNTAENGLTIGGDQAAGLNINGSTAVYADLLSLNENTLFASAPETEPSVSISPETQFVLANPVGNKTYTIVDGGFVTTGMDLTENQIKTTNPLYTVYWENQDQEEPSAAMARDAAESNPTSFVVEIIPEEVSGQTYSLNSLGTKTILDAAQNIGYGVNEGADYILRLLAPITNRDQYAAVAAQINSIALRGAAAHAHEIGISAASMVIDSVWDHTSKLAAAPHEQAKADLWITLDWNHSRANDYKAAGLDNGYKLDLYGATFGADYDFANGLAAGLAVSVGGGEAKSKGYNAGQKTDVTYWGINLYGTYTSPIVNVIGNVGYIGIKNKTKIGSDKGRPDANIWTVGVKAEKDFAINEQFTVTPHVGIRYLSVDVDDFNLQGFHYGTDRANLVQFPIGVAFAANLKTANGAAVKPFLDLSFVPTAGDKKVDNTFGITGGSARDVIDTTIASTSMFQGKIGVNASYGAHNFGLNFAIGGGNKGRLDTGLQAKYRFVF